MRRLEVAALALLVAGAAAAAFILLLALCRDRWRRRRRGSSTKRPELPLSTPTDKTTNTEARRHVALLVLLFSGRRRHLRARVEPAAATAPTAVAVEAADGHAPASSSRAAVLEDEVAAWREQWFGDPVSRTLYTIYEEREEEEEAAGAGATDGQETDTETTFYTPPTSPPRAHAVPIQLTY